MKMMTLVDSLMMNKTPMLMMICHGKSERLLPDVFLLLLELGIFLDFYLLFSFLFSVSHSFIFNLSNSFFRPEKLSHLYELVVPTLIKRFREREENVKLDVMNAMVDVFRQTLNVASVDGHHHSLVKKLATLVPDIIKGLVKELTGKSAKAKIGAFNLLTELTTVVPDALDAHVASFVPGITGALEDKAPSNLKIEALCFLKVFHYIFSFKFI